MDDVKIFKVFGKTVCFQQPLVEEYEAWFRPMTEKELEHLAVKDEISTSLSDVEFARELLNTVHTCIELAGGVPDALKEANEKGWLKEDKQGRDGMDIIINGVTLHVEEELARRYEKVYGELLNERLILPGLISWANDLDFKVNIKKYSVTELNMVLNKQIKADLDFAEG